jgi:putative tryptophan/tyrosine transport system substrate-binding protein
MTDRRRFLLTSLAGVLAMLPTAGAQQAGRMWRVGWLSNVSPTADMSTEVFKRTFQEIGYVEGRDIGMEFRWTDGSQERLFESATELVHLKVDAIVAVGPQAIRAAKQATGAVPIVMMTSGDPVSAGFVRSMARPGGNVTGVSFLGEDLTGKLLEFLKQAIPGASHVAIIWNPANSAHARYLRDVRPAAEALRVALQPLQIESSEEFDRAFERAAKDHVDAVILLLDPLFTANSRRIADLARKSRLPSVYGLRQLADAGGLMTYGPSTAVLARQVVSYLDKIFKGTKPGDLPVEQPTSFELIINLKTAKALGLTIPPSLLARADQVIE